MHPSALEQKLVVRSTFLGHFPNLLGVNIYSEKFFGLLEEATSVLLSGGSGSRVEVGGTASCAIIGSGEVRIKGNARIESPKTPGQLHPKSLLFHQLFLRNAFPAPCCAVHHIAVTWPAPQHSGP